VWGVDMGPKNKTPDVLKDRILTERFKGLSYREIANGLNADGILSQNGGKWYATTVKNIVDALLNKDEKDT
jgi:hypothetical protein